MKFLLDILDRLRPHFGKEGKLGTFKPVFDAGDAFFFSAPERTSASPHVRDPLDVKRYMSMVIVGLIPCVLASIYFFGLRVIAMILVSYIAGGAVEVFFAIVRKEKINEGFLVTGLLFPLILPPLLPLWMVAAGVVFGVLVGKELFGGTGRNLFNPALVGRCFLSLSYAKEMSQSWLAPGSGMFGRAGEYATDAISSATPLADAKSGVIEPIGNLFFGNVAGSVGETSAAAIIIGGCIIVFLGVASWRTVLPLLAAFAGTTVIFVGLNFDAILWQMLAGGLLFGAFFMATDPVTSPLTNGGKWIYGALIGAVIALIRNLAASVEGVMYAILLGNIFAPILDEIFIAVRLRGLRNER